MWEQLCESGEVLTWAHDPAATHALRALLQLALAMDMPAPKSVKAKAKRGKASAVHGGTAHGPAKLASFACAVAAVKLHASLAEWWSGLDQGAWERNVYSSQAAPVAQILLQGLAARERAAAAHSRKKSVRALPTTSRLVIAALGLGEESADGTAGRAAVLDRAMDITASHVAQVAISVAPVPIVQRLIDTVLDGEWSTLASRTCSGFVLQAVIQAVPDAQAFTSGLFLELLPLVPSFFMGHCEGVLWRMAEVCARAGAVAQAALVKKAVAAAQDGLADEAQAGALASFGGQPVPTAGPAGVVAWWLDLGGIRSAASANVDDPGADDEAGAAGTPAAGERHGQWISGTAAKFLGALASFESEAVGDVLRGLTSLPGPMLCALALHPDGARWVLEPLAESGPQLAWARRRLVGALAGEWPTIAASKFGSWLVCKVFAGVDVPRRVALAAELLESERRLQGAGPGRHVLKELRIEHFKHQRESWEAAQAAAAQKSDVLKAALAEVSAPAAGKKRARVQREEASEEPNEAPKEAPGAGSAAAAPGGDVFFQQLLGSSKSSKKSKKDKKEKKSKKSKSA